ncbi:MAG: response regulator [Verrucomicrobiota bacterium]
MDNLPEAFLSYTRLDDEFFGGAITSLRRLLELGVQVVTGNRTFDIFQDIDGIEFGEKWQAKLDGAVSATTLLIPIITPLFFKSDPCRDEMEKFIEHEKARGRDDLILPVYFVTTPLLEKPDLLKEDALATEIASRQRHDWRVQADFPPDDPQIRKDVRELAGKIAAAIARTAEPAAHIPRTRSIQSHTEDDSALVRSLGKDREIKAIRKLILWVDDNPDNNIIERKSMAAYNIHFVLAKSTSQALAELGTKQFDAIISDMSRSPDSHAGYTLLEAVRRSGNRTPYFIYAGSRAPEHVREALSRGAQGATNVGDELLQMILQTVIH